MKRALGFTLIELLIVVAIIAILAAIAMPNFLEAQVRAKVAKARSDMRTIATALETYHVDNNNYPALYIWSDSTTGHPTIEAIGSYSENRYELQVLTTPVSYLASIPQDVFGIPDKYGESWPYDYYPMRVFTRINGIGPPMNQMWWQLESRGPNLKWDVMLSYDPTNGTVSTGDISRNDSVGLR